MITIDVSACKILIINFFKKTVLILVFAYVKIAQAQTDSSIVQPSFVDKTDLPMLIRGRNATDKNNSGVMQKGKLVLFVVPIIGSNPSLGFFYGLGGTGAFQLGDPNTTSVSNLNGSIQITTKNQFVASVKGTIMTTDNEWEMLADLKYSLFAENTYGLGSDNAQPVKESWNLGGIQTTGVEGAQPMSFNQVKFYYTALKRIVEYVYVGIGYHLDHHYSIGDLSLDTTGNQPIITSHYVYSNTKNFNTNEYTTSGTSFNFVYDSRDHTLNAYKGSFLQFMYRTNLQRIGSTKDSHQMYLEARVFKALSKKRPRHLIGFWGIGHIVTSGEVPYLHLPASSYDMRNRIGRGYVMGRFRGPGWVTLESEYRFPISANGLFGGVLFANATTASREGIVIGGQSLPTLGLFDSVVPAAGFGARVLLNRSGRLNIAMDMAFGQNGAKGFYFAVGETF